MSPIPEAQVLKVAFILLPKFTLLAFSGFIEALRHAADDWDNSRQIRCRWTILGLDMEPVSSSCGVEVRPSEELSDTLNYDYVVIVGGLMQGHGEIDRDFYQYLRHAYQSDSRLIGICTGVFALAEAGILAGRRCCVHWYHAAEFKDLYPDVTVDTGSLFVEDANLITCAGGAAAMDLAIHLIQKRFGGECESKLIRQMILDRVRQANHPQSFVAIRVVRNITNPIVMSVVRLMEQHLNFPISISEICEKTGVSARQLQRLFKEEVGETPVRFYRKIRLIHGQWLVENTPESITSIALQCGFSDASHFTKNYREVFGLCPSGARGVRVLN